MAILYGCHGKNLKQEICKALARKEDPFVHQQGKRTCCVLGGKNTLLRTSWERRPGCACLFSGPLKRHRMCSIDWSGNMQFITKTCLYNFDALKPHFYIVKLGFIGVYIIFLISAQNIDCGYSLEPPRQSMF